MLSFIIKNQRRLQAYFLWKQRSSIDVAKRNQGGVFVKHLDVAFESHPPLITLRCIKATTSNLVL
ncbi:MAG: hypothetical protein CK424_06285 [Legionella sp.]|nr:MAG: hypothetical protein CK424_06285 [Legionella sp.]